MSSAPIDTIRNLHAALEALIPLAADRAEDISTQADDDEDEDAQAVAAAAWIAIENARRLLPATTPQAPKTTKAVRIRAVDIFRNVSYIWRDANGDWQCATDGGVPYYLGDKAACRDVMALRFALADTTTAEQALAVLEAHRTSPRAAQFTIV